MKERQAAFQFVVAVPLKGGRFSVAWMALFLCIGPYCGIILNKKYLDIYVKLYLKL